MFLENWLWSGGGVRGTSHRFFGPPNHGSLFPLDRGRNKRYGLWTMETTQYITDAQIDEVIQSVYAEGAPVVKEAYSDFDSPTVTFPSASDLLADIRFVPGEKALFYYTVYYPDAKGFVLEKRIELEPGACNGHSPASPGFRCQPLVC